jgi:tRNA A37 N6-isopentenylltransferase MiaA
MRMLKLAPLLLACSASVLSLAPALAQTAAPRGPQAHIERMCAEPNFAEKLAERQAKRAQRLDETLKLTDAQKAALKELQSAESKNRADMRAAVCAGKPDVSTLQKRLAFRESMLQRRLDGMKAVNPKLIAFYDSLDAGQKAKFDDFMRERGRETMKKGPGGKGEHCSQQGAESGPDEN